ncbi:MAG: hypothetical protein Q9159_001623 [Coniocarpon cinnabarinum]
MADAIEEHFRALISTVVSARVEQQLEFVAHGATWLLSDTTSAHHDQSSESVKINADIPPHRTSLLKRVPDSREDILADETLDSKAKRSINKFLRFIADLEGESQQEIRAERRDAPFNEFLHDKFRLGTELQKDIYALTASLDTPNETQTEWALRRIEQYLRSLGALGPGFAAVVPKYGGLAEVAQVCCRAQAVGGGTYMLGHGIRRVEQDMYENDARLTIQINNGSSIKARWMVGTVDNLPNDVLQNVEEGPVCSCSTSVVSGSLTELFAKASAESSEPASATITIPSEDASPPVQIIAHSSLTDECPANQCILYAMTKEREGFSRLEKAVNSLIASIDPGVNVLWQLRYHHHALRARSKIGKVIVFDEPPSDLVFDDTVLDSVKSAWKAVLNLEDGEGEFMRFTPREGEEIAEDDT